MSAPEPADSGVIANVAGIPAWHKRLAHALARHVAPGTWTVATLQSNGDVRARAGYATKRAALGQATRIGNAADVNAYVCERRGSRLILWTGSRSILVSIDVEAAP